MKTMSRRLFVVFFLGIMAAVGLALASSAEWHTPPNKWTKPRVYHTPFDDRYSSRVKIGQDFVPVQLTEKTWSPNKTYWFITTDPDLKKEGPWNTTISVFNERDYLTQILLLDHNNSKPKVRWINEKLLYIEAWWGRVLGTCMVYDAEREEIIHKEMANWGGMAFQQWRQGVREKR